VSVAFDWSDEKLVALRGRFAARLAETRRALAEDAAPAGEVAHRLKGTAAMYGYGAVGAAARETEVRLRAGANSAAAVRPLLAAIDVALTRPTNPEHRTPRAPMSPKR